MTVTEPHGVRCCLPPPPTPLTPRLPTPVLRPPPPFPRAAQASPYTRSPPGRWPQDLNWGGDSGISGSEGARWLAGVGVSVCSYLLYRPVSSDAAAAAGS